MEMTQHFLQYIHKIRGFCKADKAPEKAPEPEQKKLITEDIVNDCVKQHPDTISNYLRNESNESSTGNECKAFIK